MRDGVRTAASSGEVLRGGFTCGIRYLNLGGMQLS